MRNAKILHISLQPRDITTLLCGLVLAGNLYAQDVEPAINKVVIQSERSELYSGREIVAGKVILGRTWIENTSASSIAEALRREPSVSVGQGGKISLKGLSGYTQILVDGQTPAGGKDPLQMDPSLIERVEIIHSATADTGAFAIAGTINIITRNLRKTLPKTITTNAGWIGGNSQGAATAQGGWRDSRGLTFNVSAELSKSRFAQPGEALWTTHHGSETLTSVRESTENKTSDQAVSISPSITFKPNSIDEIQLKSSLLLYKNSFGNQTHLIDDHINDATKLRPESSSSIESSDTRSISLKSQWKRKGESGINYSLVFNVNKENSDQSQTSLSESSLVNSNSLFSHKKSTLNRINAQWLMSMPNRNGHRIQYGLSAKHSEGQVDFFSKINGMVWNDYGFNQRIEHDRSIDIDAWVQDSWNLTETLDLQFGWRQSRRENKLIATPYQLERKKTLPAPSFNLAWKLAPESQEVFTLGVARGYSTIGPKMLSPSPSIRDGGSCTKDGTCGANDPRLPDRVGNPGIDYEKSWGIDAAFERPFFEQSQWSIRAYRRNIDGVLAWVTELESVPWANTPRWVNRPKNLGRAHAHGVTLSLDSTLEDWFADSPDLAFNASLQWNQSEISTLKGPDNRFEGQNPWSFRLGVTYKSKSLPLEIHADLLNNPAYWTQASGDHRVFTGIQRDINLKAIWHLSNESKVVFSVTNLVPIDSKTRTFFSRTPNMDLRASQSSRTGIALRLETQLK